jgi:hypothetical protein
MMNFLKPNFKTAAIITAIIFAQKIYRHPSDFSFIFNEGLIASIFAILGLVMAFGGVSAFVYLGLAALNDVMKKINASTKSKMIKIIIIILVTFVLVIYFTFIKNTKVILSCSMLENKIGYFAYDKDTLYWEWNARNLLWEKSIKYTKNEGNSFIIDHEDGEKLDKEMDLILKVKKDIPSIEYTLRGETIGDPRLCKKISNRSLSQ